MYVCMCVCVLGAPNLTFSTAYIVVLVLSAFSFPQPSLFFTCLLFVLNCQFTSSKLQCLHLISIGSVGLVLPARWLLRWSRPLNTDLNLNFDHSCSGDSDNNSHSNSDSDDHEQRWRRTSQLVVSSSFATLKINIFCLLSFQFRWFLIKQNCEKTNKKLYSAFVYSSSRNCFTYLFFFFFCFRPKPLSKPRIPTSNFALLFSWFWW